MDESQESVSPSKSKESGDVKQGDQSLDPKRRVTGAARRRFRWWLRQGKSAEEAKKLAHKLFTEIPEYSQIKTKSTNKNRRKNKCGSDNITLMGIKAKYSMNEEQIMFLRKCIMDCIDKDKEGPHFCGCYSRCGIFIFKCADEHTVNWITEVFPKVKPWKQVKLTLLNDRQIKDEISLYFRRKQSKGKKTNSPNNSSFEDCLNELTL